MLNEAAQAEPGVTGGASFLILAGLAALVFVWIAVVRAISRRGAPAWLGVFVAAFVSPAYFFLMVGIGASSELHVVSGLIGIGLAFACFALANRVPLATPETSIQKMSATLGATGHESRVSKPPATEKELPIKQSRQVASLPANGLHDSTHEPSISPKVIQPAIPASAVAGSDLAILVEGMMADGVFVQAEAEYLFQWLQENQGLLDQYPASAIYQRLTEALADGVLDEDEADDISELFQRLAKNEPGVAEKVASTTPRPLPQPVPAVTSVATEAIPPKPRARSRRASTGIDRILIQYEDSLGFDSEREVTVRSVDDFYLKGYCHMRGAPRTFRIDRIVGNIVRTETGEVLPFRKWQAVHA